MKIQDRYDYDPQKDLLGKGGFARVFRATDTLLHRDVALKVFSNTGTHQYSVLSEIRKVIGLEHPNLLRYYDVVMLEGQNPLGETEQTQIGVMELANAGDLKDFARANPGSPLLYKLLKDVLLGLEYLHSKGIIHRDLKAQNILLVRQDGQLTAKISDFGISKDTGSGGQSSSMMVGTIEYMAPEQFAPGKYGIDGKVGSNLDLWSFGIMVHELLTDSTPFGSRDGDTTAEQIMSQILATELPEGIERLPEPYRSVVKKCLVANAKERIRKASELLSYFEGNDSQSKALPQTDNDSTRIYHKGGPGQQSGNQASSEDLEATKIYPKDVLAGADSTAHGMEPGNPNREQATRVYGEEPPGQGKAERTDKIRGKTVLAVAALVTAVMGSGWWYVEITDKARELADLTLAGREFKDCDDCPTMVVIPSGTFMMGSNDGEPYEKPPHQVKVSLFAMGKHEVTQGQWKAVMGNNPSGFTNCGDTCPVEQVSWNDVQQFIQKLILKTGKNYRLPSEAEWEYACRAGESQTHCGSNDINSVAVYDKNSGNKTQRVGSKRANAWRLHDMGGNVYEWTQDCWNDSYIGAPGDGSAWTAGDCGQRVLRGGSWGDFASDTRAASRGKYRTSNRVSLSGFRLARIEP